MIAISFVVCHVCYFVLCHVCYFPGKITQIVLIGNFSENIQRCVLNDIHSITSFKELFQFLRCCVE
jgi:hypothetical protein